MKRLSRRLSPGAARCLSAGVLLMTSAQGFAQAGNPAVSAYNRCAMLYNAGKTDEAITACDQAIALDPGKADAYFVKASALYGNGRIGGDGKYEIPPGTVEALNKYLDLALDGPHTQDVRAMLDALK